MSLDEVDFNIVCEIQGPGVSEEMWVPSPAATSEMDSEPK